ncbi:Stk1 family PASTA domain-containing Ser/Thr kinase [Microbacterium sp. YY-01]|uniref:Stk1 family PASTA domain-containing Ser/Thr kinase n=1 Tax=Microbacterium sp. YY-01 TaxID=3421634 RepID=UPI003D16D93D
MTTSQRADPLIGRLVDGRYRVRARIARGGMATVYVATDLRLERRVALKVMHGHLSDDSVFQSRFIQEARAAARLADPHVVNVFDQGQDSDLAYLVMEYLPGITLRQLLREQRRLTVEQTVSIMDAVLSGLAAAHRAGIVHRDVKPENVLLAEDGRIKIGDFGLARATTANTATGQQLMGTIAYLAPELVTRGTADARSDIYALGIMLYEMLTGEQPYKGEQPMQIAFQHATESVPRPSTRNPSVPEQLDELVLWSTERSPDERPNDAAAMLARLREIERDLDIRPQAPPTTKSAPTGQIETTDPTMVIPSPGTMPVAPTAVLEAPSDNATVLRQKSVRRRARGRLLLSLVLLLAAMAATVGWWFGSGPGSLIAVPDVAGSTFAEASDVLGAQGLSAEQLDAHSLEVPEGAVIRTDPEAGSRVDKGTSIDVVVSLGPAEVDLSGLNGMTEEAALAWLAENGVESMDSFRLFSGADDGIVINAEITPRGSEETYVCGGDCSAYQGDTVELYVSLGPMPDVVGMTFDRAAEVLRDKGLEVAEPEREYSDDVDRDTVISMNERGGGNWRPGDTVVLVVSDGPAPIEVPDVIGMNLRDAMAELESLGLSPKTTFPELLWSLLEVVSLDPGPGEFVERGSEVRVRATG